MLQAHRALEAKLHDSIYTNIFFLTKTYPPGKDFWDIFKRDMFLKSNKAAFHQVVYYLLYILNPNIIKEKIPSWPIIDSQYERQFRMEVAKYLNELNSLHINADLPTIMASQFVSPGGFKFAKYMLKLIILVQSEHMLRDLDFKSNMLYKPTLRKSEISQNRIKQLNLLTSNINKETDNLKLDFFDNTLATSKTEAEDITNRLNDLQKDASSLQQKLKLFQHNNDENDYSKDVDILLEGVSKIKNISSKFEILKNCISYLSQKDLALEYKSNNFNDSDLDLIDLFKQLNVKMEKYCLEMNVLTDQDLDHHTSKFTKYNDEMVKQQIELTSLSEAWLKTYNHIQNVEIEAKRCKKVLKLPSIDSIPSSSNSTVLAMPLDFSDS